MDPSRPAATATERVMLTGWLDQQRTAVRRKCTGLDALREFADGTVGQ